MSNLIFYLLGIGMGIVIGYFLFKYLTKRKERKIIGELNKGLSDEGFKFIKHDDKYKEVQEHGKAKFDREAIIGELLGRRGSDGREQKIAAIQSAIDGKQEVEGGEPEVKGESFYDRTTTDVQGGSFVQADTSAKPQQDTRRIVKLK